MTVSEVNGRQAADGDRDSRRRQYWADNYSTEALALAAVKSAAPTAVDGLSRSRVFIREQDRFDDRYLVEVEYERRSGEQDTGSSEYRFSFAAQPTHVFQSLSTIYQLAPSGSTAPNFRGAINVEYDNGSPRVRGVQLPVAHESFTYIFYPPKSQAIAPSYVNGIEAIMGTVNANTFLGRPSGSVRFIRCNGGARNNQDWSIEFGFSYIPNDTNIDVGGLITVPNKRGHDLLWVLYFDRDDNTAKMRVKRPRAAYVEQVHRYSNFSVLGL